MPLPLLVPDEEYGCWGGHSSFLLLFLSLLESLLALEWLRNSAGMTSRALRRDDTMPGSFGLGKTASFGLGEYPSGASAASAACCP